MWLCPASMSHVRINLRAINLQSDTSYSPRTQDNKYNAGLKKEDREEDVNLPFLTCHVK